jgi:hypothetical protein
MKTQTFRAVICLAAMFGSAFPIWSQIVRIQFTSEVTQADASLLPGVTVGSTITGQVEVDLAYFPPNASVNPDYVFFPYGGESRPGYIFQFNTVVQANTLDSLNAGRGLGLVPGVSLADYADSDYMDFAARDQGTLFGVDPSFWDATAPYTLLSGHYFPEDVNLAAGLDRATFNYADFFLTTTAVIAKVTAAGMTIEQATPSALLIYRVNASSLPAQRKRPLLATLDAADAAFAKGQCTTGLRNLQTFQNKVLAQVAEIDSVLADHLIAGAQAIIDSGCGN